MFGAEMKKTREMLGEFPVHFPVFGVWRTVIFIQGQLLGKWTGIIVV